MGACRIGLGYCRAFFYLGQGMWGILWLFDVSVLRFFKTSRGVYWEFLGLRVILLCTTLPTPVVTIIKGLIFPPVVFNIWMKGSYCFFVLLWRYLGIYHSRKWILWILCCLMGFGGMCVWLSIGGPHIHNMSMHVHMLGRHLHSIEHFRIVMSLGWLCWLLAFTGV